eukprot:c9594_g1_i1.p1 GENE.c9594_g1_i1~~c9594_g1_i1.p1  ORF type:complete len:258 (+),score=44.84 c9594_g1_i1:393-1166(+)
MNKRVINHVAALAVVQGAAMRGSCVACAMMGNIHHTTYDTAMSRAAFEAAVALGLEKFANEGDNMAQWALGIALFFGLGKPMNMSLARHWSEISARRGNPLAQCSFGYIRETGQDDNLNEGVAWYRKSASQGHAIAQNNLGCVFRDSAASSVDHLSEAVYWFTLSAEQGSSEGQNNLAQMIRNGSGVSSANVSRALPWYLRSAAQGNRLAYSNLGYLYEVGHGVDADEQRAMEWYSKAAELGHDYSSRRLQALRQRV